MNDDGTEQIERRPVPGLSRRACRKPNSPCTKITASWRRLQRRDRRVLFLGKPAISKSRHLVRFHSIFGISSARGGMVKGVRAFEEDGPRMATVRRLIRGKWSKKRFASRGLACSVQGGASNSTRVCHARRDVSGSPASSPESAGHGRNCVRTSNRDFSSR